MKFKCTSHNTIILYLLLSFFFFYMCINSYSFGIIVPPPLPPPPRSPLTVIIISPTSAGTLTATNGILDIGGNAYDDFAQITNITWSNDRSGSGTVNALYGWNYWSVEGIVLKSGQNNITITAYDALGTTSTAILAVYMPPPTVTINTPTSGQRWNNSPFTINGKATGTAKLDSVLYQLNSDPWNNAIGTTNWSATVNLAPGTNIVRVYAMDVSGNTSVTNTVSFDYVVTNQLKIRAVGLGNINPNYSNAWLEVGRKYTIAATPAKNFAFANWVISTNWVAGATTSSSTLQFTMQSNLTLEAHFAETAVPKITMKSPKVKNPLVNLTGTASDVWGVASVWYQLNGGAWNLATTTDNWKNWTATLPLASGVNIINAYSVNLGGKMSSTKTLKVKSKDTFKFQFGLTSANPKSNNGMNFSLQAPPELNGIIQVSTDLVNWQTLTNFVGSSSIINFCDTTCTNYHQRFYRAVMSAP